MDFGIVNVVAITVIVYIIGLGVKATKIDNRWIPVLCGLLGMGLGVAALYIVMLVVRNIVEPKLVGQQMGLHPLVTLIAMFVGLQLFGLLGLFGFPIALSLYIKLTRGGKKAASV